MSGEVRLGQEMSGYIMSYQVRSCCFSLCQVSSC